MSSEDEGYWHCSNRSIAFRNFNEFRLSELGSFELRHRHSLALEPGRIYVRQAPWFMGAVEPFAKVPAVAGDIGSPKAHFN